MTIQYHSYSNRLLTALRPRVSENRVTDRIFQIHYAPRHTFREYGAGCHSKLIGLQFKQLSNNSARLTIAIAKFGGDCAKAGIDQWPSFPHSGQSLLRRSTIHSLQQVWATFCAINLHFVDRYCLLGLGSVRTATKRAGGTVRNHGHSPGKRLGVKKFSGTWSMSLYGFVSKAHIMCPLSRRIRDTRKHYC